MESDDSLEANFEAININHGNDNLQTYKYSRLEVTDSIRILTLFAGEFDDPLVSTLRTTRLSEHPAYDAVSYVWGKLEYEGTISMNGKQLGITKNLDYALRQIRSKEGSLDLWADQLCINQDDVGERGHQVSLMGSVYRDAVTVFVCLGPDEKTIARDVFSMIEAFNETTEKSMGPFGSMKGLERIKYDAIHEFDDLPWKTVSRLDRCAWFSRAWCVQEVSLARDAVMLWGEESLNWSKLMFFQSWLRKPGVHVATYHGIDRSACRLWISYEETSRNDGSAAPYTNFLDVLDTAAGQVSASDRRDYLYAFLGHPLAQESHLGFVIRPDYGLSISNVYQDFATQCLLKTQSPRVLYSVLHRSQHFKRPTWAPRWRYIGTRIPTFYPKGLHWWYATGLDKDFSCKVWGRHLEVSGLVFDEIDFVTGSFTGRSTQLRHQNTQEPNMLPEVLDALFSSASGFSYAYGDPLEALSAVMVGGGVQAKDRADGRSNSYLRGLSSYMHAVLKTYTGKFSVPEHIMARMNRLVADYSGDEVGTYQANVSSSTRMRRVFITKKGYMGLAPKTTKPGDTLCILFGCPTPFILRPHTDQRHLMVGACYAQGLMDLVAGRLIFDQSFRTTTFHLA